MATTPTQLRIAELDYDQILQNLVTFMKADPTFSDYDFSGSGLNLIARVLAYVTFYNNYYLSTAVNESFLDTAQLRSSVVSHARMLGYPAHGMLSATYDANVTVVMSSNTAATVTIPKNTRFELQSNTSYAFYNVDDLSLTQNIANTYLYDTTNATLVEGQPATYSFVVDTNNPSQRYIIPNANVDFRHMNVRVQDSSTSNVITQFVETGNLVLPSNTDPIYVLQESYNGYPELKFGNDIVGKALKNGNIVLVDYYISRGVEGNSIRGPFLIASNTINGLVRGVTATPDANTQPSNGGSSAEEIEQIRFLAPLVYGTQNRCVTVDDYKALILSEYSESIAAINVFGGENGDPYDAQERPIYGRVFIAIKPKTGLRVTESARADIINRVVRPNSIVGVLPEVIDPDYIYMIISTRVLYDPKMTSLRRADLATNVANSIITYTASNIEKFDSAFRFSKLTRAIDDTDPAINSSMTRIELQKRIFPKVGVSNTLLIKFGTPIFKNGSESAILVSDSHRFNYTSANGASFTNCWFSEANGVVQINNTELAYQYTFNAALKNGKIVDTTTFTLPAGTTLTDTQITAAILDLYKRNPGTTVNDAPIVSTIQRPVVVNTNAGTLDITTGVMTLSNFVPDAIEDGATDIWINVLPQETDLVPQLNRLFTLDSDTIVVEVADETSTSTAANFYQGGVLR
jgi:hypothetical protein